MKPYSKYDPEDIESLLLHKQFHELYPEEKEFILQHIETPEEYDSLRKTLFELRDAANDGTWLEPDASLKKDLMAQFASEEKGGFRIWLNSLFTWPDVQWYRQPALRVAFAGACVLLGVLFFINYDKNEPTEFAENRKTETQQTPKADADSIKTEHKEEEKNLFAENLTVKEMPAAPATTYAPEQMPSELDKQRHEAAKSIGKIVETTEDEIVLSPASEDIKDADYTNTTHQTVAMEAQTDKALSKEAPVNSVNVAKASGNYKNVNLADVNKSTTAVNSRSLSEVNDLLSFLFTAQ